MYLSVFVEVINEIIILAIHLTIQEANAKAKAGTEEDERKLAINIEPVYLCNKKLETV